MSNRIELGVVPLASGGVFVDDAVRQAQETALKTAADALDRAAEEERQRQALEEATKPPPAPPARKLIALIGPKASGFFSG